jgi:TetR/AcrR family transcriptional regulator
VCENLPHHFYTDEPMADAPNSAPTGPDAAPVRKRPKPGERRLQILQTLAVMLEAPGAERVTTAALASRLDVSEAALYRHFASKAQMFEGLLDFIEESVFSLINRITAVDAQGSGASKARAIVTMVLQFAQKNPGMARVMVGDALVLEHPRLQQRMNQFFDKLEAALKQALRDDGGVSTFPATADAATMAAVLVALVGGRMQRFVRSDFSRSPTDRLDAQLALVLG